LKELPEIIKHMCKQFNIPESPPTLPQQYKILSDLYDDTIKCLQSEGYVKKKYQCFPNIDSSKLDHDELQSLYNNKVDLYIQLINEMPDSRKYKAAEIAKKHKHYLLTKNISDFIYHNIVHFNLHFKTSYKQS